MLIKESAFFENSFGFRTRLDWACNMGKQLIKISVVRTHKIASQLSNSIQSFLFTIQIVSLSIACLFLCFNSFNMFGMLFKVVLFYLLLLFLLFYFHVNVFSSSFVLFSRTLLILLHFFIEHLTLSFFALQLNNLLTNKLLFFL